MKKNEDVDSTINNLDLRGASHYDQANLDRPARWGRTLNH
jgi:hypothetical protein